MCVTFADSEGKPAAENGFLSSAGTGIHTDLGTHIFNPLIISCHKSQSREVLDLHHTHKSQNTLYSHITERNSGLFKRFF